MRKDQYEVKFDTVGMMDIFGRAIYTDPSAAVRELLQNANDAIIEKYPKATGNNLYIAVEQDDISLEYRPASGLLIVQDTGVGMSYDEVTKYLNNFGFSAKSQDRLKRMGAEDITPFEARNLIGRYGVGLLSALSISYKVEILTRNCTDGPLTRWEYHQGDTHFNQEQLSEHDWGSRQGTVVKLELNEEAAGHFADNDIVEITRNFSQFLHPMVRINTTELNPNRLLMQTSSTEEDWGKFLRDEYDPMEGTIKRIVRRSDDGKELINGVIFVPRRKTYSIFGTDSKLFINRMAIPGSDAVQDLLPHWARYFTVIINSEVLERQTSGESLIKNEPYRIVKAMLRQEVVSFIKSLSRSKDVFAAALGQYANEIKRACIEDEELMRGLGASIPLKTVQGVSSTLSEYLELAVPRTGQNDIFMYENSGEEGTAQVLRSSVQIPIINAVYDSDAEFLREYAKINDCKVRGLSALVSEHFEDEEAAEVNDNRELISNLLQSGKLKIRSKFKKFRPASVPAILVFDEEAASNKQIARRLLEDAAKEGMLGSDASGLLSSLDDSGPSIEIYINTSNPTVRELLGGRFSTDDLRTMVLALYNSAYMFNFRSLTDDETQAIFQTTNLVISKLASHCNMILRDTAQSDSKIEERRGCVVGIDLAASNNFLNNLSAQTASLFYARFAQLIDQKARRYRGFLAQFSGDGGFVYFPGENAPEAFRFSQEMRLIVEDVWEEMSEVEKNEMDTWAITRPSPRIVATLGTVYVGKFGANQSIVGKAVVDCWGILEQKSLLDEAGTSVFVTSEFSSRAGIPDRLKGPRVTVSVAKSGNVNFEVIGVG